MGKFTSLTVRGLLVYTRRAHVGPGDVSRRFARDECGASGIRAEWLRGFLRQLPDRGRAYTFCFHVEGALVRTLIGQDRKRLYELSGKRLRVRSPDPKEHWRVAWEHY